MTDASIVREESHWKKGKNGSMLNSVIRSVASGCIKLDLPSDKPRYPERRLLVSTPGTSERRKRVNKVKQGGEEERKRVGRKNDGQRGEWNPFLDEEGGLVSGIREGGSASSTVRHRHRISVKSKGADLVARKLATKFGEKAEAAGGGGVGEAQRESIRPVESRSTSFGWLASSPPSSTPSPPPPPTRHFVFPNLWPSACKVDKVSRLHFPSPFLYPLPIPIPGLAPPIPTPPAITKRRVLIPSRLVSPRSYSRLFLATSNPLLLLLAFFLLPLRRASLSIYLCLSVFLFLGGNRDRFYDRSVVSYRYTDRFEQRFERGEVE